MPEEAVTRRIRVGVVGVGKMGLSHLAIVRALKNVELVGVVDATDYLLDILNKYTGAATYSSLDKMLDEAKPEAILIATPTGSHAALVRSALEQGVHVFCEKPLTLTAVESAELTALAATKGLVAQVGYHNRFIATFQEVKRLLDLNAIGNVTHVLAEAYGPVVLKPKGSTWRSKRTTGGGCLYDYAAHPLDLVHWYLGTPQGVRGSVLNSIFSADTDDEVYSTLDYADGLSVQLSVNWSDESYRKMSTSMTVTGSQGRIVADRQEIRVYLRDGAAIPEGYRAGWNILYTTDLTEQVSFYLRGEEYSAQLEAFVAAVAAGEKEARQNSFASASETDRVIEWILQDAATGTATGAAPIAITTAPAQKRGLFGRGKRA
ncbi:Gfo/Idh/MocA family oxidoreductase [Microbacterium sp. KSW4-16]|uniref:Gfo/Idh/MocA family protein n=1 Tax=Microbacterium TaxID=33882 RepID=UPI001D147508|nr:MULTISPECIES: Gfo/Idh/MocA family oxidoreductase [Microbacterium]MCK8467177.1 Gfo/Idh/MocA family oxidoreductase [Microbacterium aurugineum]MCZ4300112.1 Gfo/Idh/MocA family oxidoreductase [Microbacterium oxydans]